MMLFLPILLSCFSPNISSYLIAKLGYFAFWYIEVVLFAFQVFFIVTLLIIRFVTNSQCWNNRNKSSNTTVVDASHDHPDHVVPVVEPVEDEKK